jgi:hypothetical protein
MLLSVGGRVGKQFLFIFCCARVKSRKKSRIFKIFFRGFKNLFFAPTLHLPCGTSPHLSLSTSHHAITTTISSNSKQQAAENGKLSKLC